MGTVAGLHESTPAVLWFDAHGDLHTPDTTRSGILDGMALATLTGRCWRQLVHAVSGIRPVRDRQVLLLGARDLDAAEAALLESTELTWHAPEQVPTAIATLLERLSSQAGEAYVHLDLDVLDPLEARANGFAAPGGLGVRQACGILENIGRTTRVAAVASTAYDPACDPEARVCRAASMLLTALLGGATGRR